VIPVRRRRERRQEPVVAPPSGIACCVGSCVSLNAQVCSYRDRRGRTCSIACCNAHGIALNGARYCRRHASTVRAITAPAGHANGVAGLQDRAPSLISWIANDVDDAIRTLLATAARSGERVITDGYVQLTRDIVRRARWERSWRIVDNTGLVLKVSLYIDEGDGSLVHMRVGDLLVGEGVPPWIARRGQGEDVAAAIDISQRQQFYRSIEATIAAALQDRDLFRRD
jgi:hypothetical protein